MPDFMRFTCVFCSNSQMKSPGITTCIAGKNKTLYMQTVKSIEQRTKENLKKTLKGKSKWNSNVMVIYAKFALYVILNCENFCCRNLDFWGGGERRGREIISISI